MRIFKLPDLGEGLPDAEIIRWHVQVGDEVQRDQILAEMETAKAVVDVPSPQAGCIEKLHGQPGDIIQTGAALVTFASTDAAPAKPATSPPPQAPYTFRLPDLGEGLPDAEIVGWHVQTGDHVLQDQSLASMETAKAVVEVPAPLAGRIVRLYGQRGDIIATGSPLVDIQTDTTLAQKTASHGGVVGDLKSSQQLLDESSHFNDGIHASPAVRALARKHRIDLTTLQGSGPDGSIRLSDVYGAITPASNPSSVSSTAIIKAGPAARALASKLKLDLNKIPGSGPKGFITVDDVKQAQSTPTLKNLSDGKGIKAAPKVRARAKELGVDLHALKPSGHAGNITLADVEVFRSNNIAIAGIDTTGLAVETENLRGARRAMFISMSEARTRVMNTTLFDDADISNWAPKTDITLRFIRALIAACRAEPALNAWLDDHDQQQRRILHQQVHLGIAVDSPYGLYVPVIKNCQSKASAALRSELNRLRHAVQNRSTKSEDLQGASISLSNFGTIAGRYATPVVTPPQVAILATGGFYEQPGFDKNNQLCKCRYAPLSLSFDHRAATGGEAARFLAAVRTDLQQAT